MKDEDKTKEQLMNVLAELRQRVVELEKSAAERKRAEEVLKEHSERLEEMEEQRTKYLGDVQNKLSRKVLGKSDIGKKL